MGLSPPRRSWLIVALAACVALVVSRGLWLPAFGEFLVQADPPQRAEVAVVLAGGASGSRILTAARLASEGFVDKVLVSNTNGCYGLEEADLAIDFAVKRGYRRDYFIKTEHKSKSTGEEAQTIVPKLRSMSVREFLLVTSDYHTRRARRIFNHHLDGLRMRVIAAPDPDFQAGQWWRNREARKIVFMEWTKTVAGTFGL